MFILLNLEDICFAFQSNNDLYHKIVESLPTTEKVTSWRDFEIIKLKLLNWNC